MKIPAWFRDLTTWAGDERWVLWLIAMLVAVIAVDLMHRLIMRGLQHHARRTSHVWDTALIWAISAPVSMVIWVFGIATTMAITASNLSLGWDVLDYLPRAFGVGIVLAAAWFGQRLARGIEQAMIQRYVIQRVASGPDRTTIEAIGKIIRALFFIVALLLILQAFGVQISGLLAVGGVGGIAIGFAARDMLANFFGSAVIHMDRPFSVGDWIRSPDRDVEGVVEHIGWRLSRLRTFDARPLYVPNAVFVTAIIENPSRMSHRRIYETINVRIDDVAVVADVVSDVREMLEGRDEVDLNEPVIVNVLDYNASVISLIVYCLVTETRWVAYHGAKQDVLLKIADIISDHGAQIAYPTETLHIASVPGGEPQEAPDIEDTDEGDQQSSQTTYGEAGNGGGGGDGA